MKRYLLAAFLGTLSLLVFNCTKDWTLDPQFVTVVENLQQPDVNNTTDCKEKTFFSKDSSTVALWYFNEGGTSTIVKDYAGNHDLSFVSNPQWVNGQYGHALNFSNNNCTTPFVSDLFPSNAITVEALVYIDSLPSPSLSPRPQSVIVSNAKWNSGSSGARGYELRLTDSDGKVEFVFGDQDQWNFALSVKKVVPGKWYKIAGQYDGNRISVYVDDELWASTDYIGKIQSSSVATTIARRIDDQPFYFYGKIDELRISSTPRYIVNQKSYFPNDGATIALWHFDEGGTATTVKDLAGNHNLSFVYKPLWVKGQYGLALQFSNSNCVTPYAPDLFPSSAITVEALVFIDSLPPPSSPRSHSMIVSNAKWNSGSSGARGYELRLTDSDGKVEFIFGDQDQWNSAISIKKVVKGKWYKIAGQYDGKQISVYVNDELWASTDYVGKIQTSSVATTVARRIDDQPFYFYGVIDEMRISSIRRY
jgi:hypothetical protein